MWKGLRLLCFRPLWLWDPQAWPPPPCLAFQDQKILALEDLVQNLQQKQGERPLWRADRDSWERGSE